MPRYLPLALALLVAGCSADEPTDDLRTDERLADEVERTVRDNGAIDVRTDEMAISTQVDGDELESILTRDGQMELGLTDQVLYSRLSKQAQADVQAELQETASQDGLGGRIARAVAEAAAENVGTAVQIPVGRILDIRVDDGRLVVEMADGDDAPFGNARTGDTPLLDAFEPDDAQRLADAFQRMRQ